MFMSCGWTSIARSEIPCCCNALRFRTINSSSYGVARLASSRGQASLHPAEFDTPVSGDITSFLCLHVTVTCIIQVQVRAGNPMLVLIDPVDSAHEHESHASGRAQPVFERSPVWFHFASPFIAVAAVGSQPDCWP